MNMLTGRSTARAVVAACMLTGGLLGVGATGDSSPPDYCRQDPDWYLCQHHHEPSRTGPATPELDRTGNRGPNLAATVWSVSSGR